MGSDVSKSPTEHHSIVEFMRTCKNSKGLTLNSTEDYDIEKFLPAMLKYIRSMPERNNAERAQIAAMTLHRQSHGLRAMSLANMCPLVKNVRLPPTSASKFWCGNFPLVIGIGYDQVGGQMFMFVIVY